MKKLNLALLFLVTCLCSCKDVYVTYDKLPQVSQDFITTHLSDVQVAYIQKEHNEFDVKFSNGWSADFDKQGNLKGIDCNDDSVPFSVVSLLPSVVFEQSINMFPGAYISEINIGKLYKVELINGCELYFDKKGKLISAEN